MTTFWRCRASWEASDRLAAEVIGVTGKTVAAVRLKLTAEIPQLAPGGGGPGNRTRKPEDKEAAAKRQAKLGVSATVILHKVINQLGKAGS